MVNLLMIVYINKEILMDFVDKFIILATISLNNSLMVNKKALKKDTIKMEITIIIFNMKTAKKLKNGEYI